VVAGHRRIALSVSRWPSSLEAGVGLGLTFGVTFYLPLLTSPTSTSAPPWIALAVAERG